MSPCPHSAQEMVERMNGAFGGHPGFEGGKQRPTHDELPASGSRKWDDFPGANICSLQGLVQAWGQKWSAPALKSGSVVEPDHRRGWTVPLQPGVVHGHTGLACRLAQRGLAETPPPPPTTTWFCPALELRMGVKRLK